MYYSKRERYELMLRIMRAFSFEIGGVRIAAVTKSVREVMTDNLGVSDSSIQHYLVEMVDDGVIRKGYSCEYIVPHDGFSSMAEEDGARQYPPASSENG